MTDDTRNLIEQQRVALDACQRLAFKAWETTAKLTQCNLRATNALLPTVLPWAAGRQGDTAAAATDGYDPARHLGELREIVLEGQSELTRIGSEQTAATLALVNDLYSAWFSHWGGQGNGSQPQMPAYFRMPTAPWAAPANSGAG